MYVKKRYLKSKSEVAKPHMKAKDMCRSKKATRSVRSFHPNTISIPEDETIGIYEGKVTYTEVIDAVSGESLGVPDMDVVRETMRPTNDPACRERGEYYIANFRSKEDQEVWEQGRSASSLGMCDGRG